MGSIIGAIISAIIQLGIISVIMIWAGYWIIKKAVRNGILEAYDTIREEEKEEEEDPVEEE